MLITAVKTQKRFRHRLERQYALYLKEKHKADWLQNRRSGHISLPLQFKPTGTVYCTRQTTRTRPYIDTGRTVSRRTQEKTESRFLVRDKIPPTRSTGLSLNDYYPSLNTQANVPRVVTSRNEGLRNIAKQLGGRNSNVLRQKCIPF